MIISHKHRFIFIKSKKTAGTSIEIDLSSRLGPDDVITPISPDDEKHPLREAARNHEIDVGGNTLKLRNHNTIVDAIRVFGVDLADYFVFTCERDPIDKVLSGFYWSRRDVTFDSIEDEVAAFHEYVFFAGARVSSFDQYAIHGTPIVDFVVDQAKAEQHLQEIYDRFSLGKTRIKDIRAKGATRPPHSRGEEGRARFVSPRIHAFIELVSAREARLLSGDWQPIPRDIRERLYLRASRRLTKRERAGGHDDTDDAEA